MQLARLAAAATCSIALGALGGCFRDGAKAPPLENRAGAPRAVSTSDLLAFLPKDSEVVIGLDARQLLGSPLWQHFEPRVLRAIGQDMEQFRKACGYDPVAALRGVTIGMKTGEPEEAVFVVRGLPRDQTMACLGRVLARQGQVTVQGKIVLLPGEPAAALTFVDATTLVLATSRDELEEALAAGAPLRTSRAFAELWGQIDPKHAAWMIANGAARAFSSMASMGVRPRAMLGSIALGDGVTLFGRLRLPTADEATQLAAVGQAQLGAVQSMVSKIELGAEGPDVTLRVEMTDAQVQALAGLLLPLVSP
jgi:hypothetical protein